MRAVIAIFLVVVLSGCAVGYARDDRALGFAIGSAEIRACQAPAVGSQPIPMDQQSCQEIKGSTISKTGSSLIGKIFGLVINIFTALKATAG